MLIVGLFMSLVSDYHKGQKRRKAWLYQTDFIVVMRGGVFLFSSFFLVHLPLLRCCLAQQTKLCKETKKVWLQMHLVEKSKMRSEMFSSLDVISIL